MGPATQLASNSVPAPPRLPDAFRRRAARPAIVGHRGARADGVFENTVASFEEAARQGADAIELDVRPGAGGELLVFHDPDLWRAAGDPRLVAGLIAREVSRLAGADVPTLHQALDLARSRGLGVNVELKRDVPDRAAAARAVAAALSRWDRSHDVIVSSFDPGMLRAHRALAPHLCHAALVHRSAYDSLALLATRLLSFSGAHVHTSLVTPRVVGPLLARGAYCAAWTVNDVVVARRAFALGVEAIITDEPGRVRTSFEALSDERRSV